MFKRFVLLSLITMTTVMTVNAQVFKGKALSEISTTNPSETIKVQAMKDINLGDGIEIKKGDTITGKMTDIVSPQKFTITGKMTDIVSPQKFHKNSSFTFIPTEYTSKDGKTHKITSEIKATYRQKMKADFEHSEIGVGGTDSNSMFVFSPSYISNTKKILNGQGKEVWNDYQNRSTPWGKGEEINIKTNELIYFNFPDVQ